MGTMTQVYSVPIVFPNTRQDDSLFQIFDALEGLESVVEDVFGRIKNRVSHEKSRIDAISSRIDAAKGKVARVAGSTKAITVHSSARYPAPKGLDEYRPLYTDVPRVPPKHPKHRLPEAPQMPIVSLRDPVMDDPFLPESSRRPEKAEDLREGLGRLPTELESISSLLLFNTQENPYKKYVSLDNLAGKEFEAPVQDKKSLADAPTTLGAEGDQLPQVGLVEYGYKPVLGDVPEFNLPSVLPDLPMVADINWNSIDIPEFAPIAPSTRHVIADQLPDVTPDNGGEDSGLGLDVPDVPAIDGGGGGGMAPPPPPPVGNFSAPPPPPPPAGNTPPPPPPPAGNIPPPPPTASTDESSSGGGDARSSLLEDIRKGHKGRLKNASSTRNLEDAPPSLSGDNNPAAAPPPVSTGDIFSDLIMALNRRRVGLKGEAPPKKRTKKTKAPAEAEIALPDLDGDFAPPDLGGYDGEESSPAPPPVPDLGDDGSDDEGSSDSEWEV